MRLELIKAEKEFKHLFKPREERIHTFERWAMEWLYALTYHDVLGIKGYDPKEVIDNCVWNGNELYNAKYQICLDKGKQSRMWMTDKGVIVLELIDDDFDVPNELYYYA